jgi:hypothetical protein
MKIALPLLSCSLCTTVSSTGIKQQEREADDSSPFSTEVKNELSYSSTPVYAFMACM